MEYKFNFIGYQNYPHQVLFDFFYMYFKDNEKAAFFMVAIYANSTFGGISSL